MAQTPKNTLSVFTNENPPLKYKMVLRKASKKAKNYLVPGLVNSASSKPAYQITTTISYLGHKK